MRRLSTSIQYVGTAFFAHDRFALDRECFGSLSGKALTAVLPVSIGGLHVTVSGDADNAAINQISWKLEAFGAGYLR